MAFTSKAFGSSTCSSTSEHTAWVAQPAYSSGGGAAAREISLEEGGAETLPAADLDATLAQLEPEKSAADGWASRRAAARSPVPEPMSSTRLAGLDDLRGAARGASGGRS